MTQLWGTLQVAAHITFIFYPFTFWVMAKYLLQWKRSSFHIDWSRQVCGYFKLRVHKLGRVDRYREGRVIYLFNHRTMADIFLHDVITEGTAAFLARYLIGVLFLTSLIFNDTVWFFRRGVQRDFKKFYAWLDYKFQNSYRENLLVYPEGHRMQLSKNPSKLKQGMLKYAYERNYPVQICITFGNENALSEDPPMVNRAGTDIYYQFDEAIKPGSFGDESEFIAEVERRFALLFYQVYEQYSQVQGSL